MNQHENNSRNLAHTPLVRRLAFGAAVVGASVSIGSGTRSISIDRAPTDAIPELTESHQGDLLQPSGQDILDTPVASVTRKIKHPVSPYLKLANLHPERLHIPKMVSYIMRDNVTYIPNLSCSGFLIRDSFHTPIGVETAQHCVVDSLGDKIMQPTPGNFSIDVQSPLTVKLGDTMAQLKDAGNVSTLFVSRNSHMRDRAVGLFENSSASTHTLMVQSRVKRSEVNKLKKGDQVYLAGWPWTPDNNQANNKQQQFALSVLGITSLEVQQLGPSAKPLELKILLTAVRNSNDGAICSFRGSGGVGFRLDRKGHVVRLGPLSAFAGFSKVFSGDATLGAQQRAGYEVQYGVNLEPYSGVCGFNISNFNPRDVQTIHVNNTPPA